MADGADAKLKKVGDADLAMIVHLPYRYECPLCGQEQEDVLMCVLCGSLFPAECEFERHQDVSEEFLQSGLSLHDVVRTKWPGEPSILAGSSMEPVSREQFGFLVEHSHPKRSESGHHREMEAALSARGRG